MADDVESGDELLATLVDWVDNAEDATSDARKLSERDRDYYDNIQWTSEEIAALEKRGQPVITINRIKRKVDYLEGVEKQQRTDPKAYPRNPNDEGAATAATDGIRFVCDKERYDSKRSAVWKNLMIEGYGGVLCGAKLKGDTKEVTLMHLPWDRVGYDPHSYRPDFSDARYTYFITWMDQEDAEAQYPEKKDILGQAMASVNEGETYDDKPKHLLWADEKRKRIKVVEIYYQRGGAWQFAQFTQGGILASGPSPYVDEDNEPENPMILVSAFVNRENDRYGAVREMIGPQDEINKRRSKALHLISVNQVIIEDGATQDEQKLRTELAKPDGVITVNPGMKAEFRDGQNLAQAHFQLLQEAKNEIDLMGPNASMGGKGVEGQSGRAIIAQQQGGFVEMGALLDRLRQFNYAVYRAIWNRIRQFWTEERWIRVTDDERNLKFIGFNRQVTVGEQMAKRQGMPEEQIQQMLPQIQAHPQYGQPVMENVPADIDVDIIVQEAPDSVTIQMEQFEQLVQLATSGAVPIPPDVLIQAAPNLRDKDKLLEAMKPQPDPAQQEAQQKQQQIAEQGVQLEFAEKQAKIAEMQAKTAKHQADIHKVSVDNRETVADTNKTVLETVLMAADPPDLIPQVQ